VAHGGAATRRSYSQRLTPGAAPGRLALAERNEAITAAQLRDKSEIEDGSEAPSGLNWSEKRFLSAKEGSIITSGSTLAAQDPPLVVPPVVLPIIATSIS